MDMQLDDQFYNVGDEHPGSPAPNQYFHETMESNAFYRVILQNNDATDEEVIP